ncbi:MAG TPA: MOSC N-terminal beta barrel domain-containing protein [Lacunisphaera sp.]|jgi:hypothetical protein
MLARVSATYLYPIKACAALRVPSLTFESTGGLGGDRSWVVVDADDRVTWQGAIPSLARILPVETSGQLAIASAAGDSAVLPPPGVGVLRVGSIWNSGLKAFDTFSGHDAGDAVAELASTIAGEPVRLVRPVTSAHKPNPAHVISESSLNVMSAQLGQETDLLRFRPNIVICDDDGRLTPFAEERATSLVCWFGNVRFVLAITAPCERCVVINVDPTSGAIDPRFLKTVAAHSRGRGIFAPAAFGVYVRATAHGTVAVGDRVELVTSRD